MNGIRELIKTEVLIDDEFFTCIKNSYSDNTTEYGLSQHKSIEDTIKRLLQLYNRENLFLNNKEIDLKIKKG